MKIEVLDRGGTDIKCNSPLGTQKLVTNFHDTQ